MMGSGACFAVMVGVVRHVAESGMHPFEIAFFRNLFGALAMFPWLLNLGLASFRKARHSLYAVRACGGAASMLAWFWALSMMPITEATALSFTAPFFTTVLAAIVLGEVVRLRRWMAVAVGFAGAMVILRPGTGAIEIGPALAVLFSAGCVAVSTVTIKELARTERPGAIVAFTAIYLTPISLVPALFVWTAPTWPQLGWLAVIGSCGTIAHLCLTRALRLADASAVIPFDFARLIFVAVVGWFAFGQRSDVWTWVGTGIIFASGVYIAQREAAAAREGRAKAARTAPVPPDAA